MEKKGDPKKLSESIVQADQAKLATVEGNIPDVQNLLDGIKQQLNDVMAEVAKNHAKITELRKYVNDPAHKRDEWSDPATDEDLAKDYPEYGDVLTALKELTQLNKAKIQELSTAAEWSNKVTSNNT